MKDIYKILKNKEIIAILNGDTKFEDEDGNELSMPYLSGSDLCSISTLFGLPEQYSWSGGALSRWMYLDNLIEYCVNAGKTEDLLTNLFSKKQFANKLKGLSPDEIDARYKLIVNKAVEQISGILYFGGHEFAFIDNQFLVKPIGITIKVETPKITKIDRYYIKSITERAVRDIDESNYDSAITKCRTLVEEVFCYAIELKDEEPSDSGDISGLYKHVKTLYDMHPDKEHDKRLNMLLSGLEKIITSIAQMRNREGDSHGVGKKRIRISEHHARLYLNAAMMISDFILEVARKKKEQIKIAAFMRLSIKLFNF